jgi:hypothetical protein
MKKNLGRVPGDGEGDGLERNRVEEDCAEESQEVTNRARLADRCAVPGAFPQP